MFNHSCCSHTTYLPFSIFFIIVHYFGYVTISKHGSEKAFFFIFSNFCLCLQQYQVKMFAFVIENKSRISVFICISYRVITGKEENILVSRYLASVFHVCTFPLWIFITHNSKNNWQKYNIIFGFTLTLYVLFNSLNLEP